MDLVPEDDIFSFGLGLSWILGEYTKNPFKKLYIYRNVNISIVMLTWLFILLNLQRVNKDMYIREIESVITVLHVSKCSMFLSLVARHLLQTLLKYIFYVYYKPEVIKIFKWKREFYNYQECDGSVYMACKNIYKKFDVIHKCYSVIGLTAAFVYALRPLFNENNKFIFDCWYISNSLVFETIALFFQYHYLVFAVPIVFGYDIIYFCCCAHLIVHLKILRYKLRNIGCDSKQNEVYECVEHHQLSLLVFSCMKDIYFWMLLFHYVVTLVTCCVQLYALLISSSGTADLAQALLYILMLLVQFACYSFPAEQMVFELRSISVAIYASMWYETRAPIMKTLQLMMMRSQRQEYLTAGGMIDMNVDTFGSVVRKAFSFYAILRNVLNN